jgi:F-type H+-transporting ATPase subunit b
MLNINPGLILWTIITFVLLLIVLRKFAWKPLLEALHSREESIRSSIEKSEKAKAEAEIILEENKRQMALAGNEVRRLIKEGEANADKRRAEIEREAQQKAERRIKEAEEEITRLKEGALVELRGEVADLAISAASKILDEILDEKRHKKIIDDALAQLPKN